MRELTKRQAEILNFIRRFMGDNGFPPTLHELCREFGFGSTNAATQFLRTLERKGHIRRPLRGASRGITLIEQGELSAAKQTPMRNLVIISTKAATPLDAFMQPEGQIAVDAAYYGLNDKAFAVRVNDFAMKNIGIGLAYVAKPNFKVGSDIFIQIRNKSIPAKVVKLPFV